MRTTKWIISGCVALLLGAVSCSKALSAGGDDVYDGPVMTHYLSVNIVSSDDGDGPGGTRASGGGSATGDGSYEAGDQHENTIHSVRFYFFKANGEAADVKYTDGHFVNYMDWYPTAGGGEIVDATAPDDVVNVERIVRAQLVINTKEGDGVPSQIVAIVNPPTDMPVVGSIDGTNALNAIASNYSLVRKPAEGQENVGGEGDPYFVMSNSVYVDRNGHEAEAVSVDGHLYPTVEAALLNPVTLFVERVNAKASVYCRLDPVTVNGEKLENTYDTGARVNNLTDKGLTSGKIYVKFLGWDVTRATNKSYLMKHVDASWTDKGVFGASSVLKWNIPAKYRSFWAINPDLVAPAEAGSNYVFKTFNEHAEAVDDFAAQKYLYLQENAADVSGTDASGTCAYPTQLIIAARLTDEEGEALTLAEYGFFQYTLDGLKLAMADKAEVYKKVSTQEGDGFAKIEAEDIVLLTATEAGQAGPNSEGRYYVYAAIKGTGPDGVPFDSQATAGYYLSNGEDAQPATYKELNARLVQNCGKAKLWEEGKTYYYVDIQHLGEEASNGWKGIVRNHIYAMNITKLVGLGTPVYRPDEVIYPEKPSNDETYIGADVLVLNWRIIHQEISFAW